MRLPIGTVLTFLLLSGAIVAADFTGTWKLDPAKSKLQNSDIASDTMVIQQTGPNKFRTTIDIVTKTGEKRHQEMNRVFDGQEHPEQDVGRSKHASEICKIVSSSTRTITQKEDGKVVMEITSTVSADGKVMTNVRKGSAGEDVLVFEKQ